MTGVALSVLAIVGVLYGAAMLATQLRQEAVVEPGAVPFDLEKTTHVFEATGSRSVAKVKSDDDADAEQSSLRRGSSGRKRASSGGNLSDLVAIHGEEMPGLKELEAGAERTDFRYAELPNGVRIEYATMVWPSSRSWTGGSRRRVPITGSTPHQTMRQHSSRY